MFEVDSDNMWSAYPHHMTAAYTIDRLAVNDTPASVVHRDMTFF